MESQCVCGQIHLEPVERLHVVYGRSGQRRSVSSAGQSHLHRLRCFAKHPSVRYMACRPRRHSASSPATITSKCKTTTRSSASSSRTTSFTMSREGNTGIYAEKPSIGPTGCARPPVGVAMRSRQMSIRSCKRANSGSPQMAIGSPKFTATFGPFERTEFFAGLGMGYHSNDARATVLTQTPGDPTDAGTAGAVPGALARPARSGSGPRPCPDLNSSISVFYLHQGLGTVLQWR